MTPSSNDFSSPVDPVSIQRGQLIAVLERIARVQEGLLSIAMEARQERLKLSARMQEALKRPLEERPGA